MFNKKAFLILFLLITPMLSSAQWLQKLLVTGGKKSAQQTITQSAANDIAANMVKQAVRPNLAEYVGARLASDGQIEQALKEEIAAYYHQKGALEVHEQVLSWQKALDVDPRLGMNILNHNRRLAGQFEANTFKNYDFFIKNKHAIQSTVKEHVATYDKIDYTQIIPQDKRMLFLGEEHNNPQVIQGVYQLVSQYQKKYNRKVILAVERLETDNLSADDIITSVGRLPLRTPSQYNTPFEKLIQQGVAILPLEYVGDVSAAVAKNAANGSMSILNSGKVQKLEDSLLASFVGVDMRNRAWAKSLHALRQKVGPDAMIIVWGGSMHFTPSVPGALSSLLPREKSMVISFDRVAAKTPDYFTNWDQLELLPETQSKIERLRMDTKGKNIRVIRVTDQDAYASILGGHVRILIPQN